MYLLILLVVFAVIGYFLANSKLGEKVDTTAGSIVETSQNWKDNARERWFKLINRRSRAEKFRTWAAANQSDDLKPDFESWLGGLTDQEAESFCRGLADYAKGLDFNLDDLIDGGLDRDPVLRQVFVETIVIYSDAYRKAKQAHERVHTPGSEQSKEPLPENEKKTAQKQSSRRKHEIIPEAKESAPAV